MEQNCRPTQTPDDIDVAGIVRRYAEERDKRLRSDAAKQYVEVGGAFLDQYESDPYSAPITRDPIFDNIDVAILGGGFAGMMVAADLKKAGITNLRVIEMGGDFGGTWYWNRYPGVQCDVESYTYLPLLEETNYVPREKYSYGPEIYEHCRRIGRHYDLYRHALFDTIIRSLIWDDAIKRWLVATSKGDEIRARFVIVASGSLNKPKLPGIPGISSFKGHSFHTSRWDFGYTGGDTNGSLTRLADKRVALIGTGATGVQCTPFLGEYAKQLYVFQRTPSSVDARGNRPTDPEWVKSLKPGWKAERQRNFHAGLFEGLSSPSDDLVCDGWGELSRNLAARLAAMGNPDLSEEQISELRELENHRVMERLRRRVDEIVTDKRTADLLKPWYGFMCKRPCFNDNYLETFNRENVTLVDVSETKGVERITEKGIVAHGTEYEVDCIIYASGFETPGDLKRKLGIDTITGRDGMSLYAHWADGHQTLHGMTTHKFPNFFYIGYSQNAVSAAHNLMYEQLGGHIAYIIKEVVARGATTVETSKEAQDAWVKTVRNSSNKNTSYLQECTPGYFNQEGALDTTKSHLGEPYPGGFYAFEELLEEWRQEDNLNGLILER